MAHLYAATRENTIAKEGAALRVRSTITENAVRQAPETVMGYVAPLTSKAPTGSAASREK